LTQVKAHLSTLVQILSAHEVGVFNPPRLLTWDDCAMVEQAVWIALFVVLLGSVLWLILKLFD